MNKRKAGGISTQTLTLCSILTAIVVLLQFLGAFVRFGPFSISLVLLPIVVGAATCGPMAGLWLGVVFAVMVFATGDAGAFLGIDFFGTVVTVLLKGALCGYLAGLTYSLISKKNRTLAVISSAIVCPVVNTGVFLLGCRLFFFETLASWGAEAGFTNAVEYMFLGLAGGNFLFELALNIILTPVIVRLLTIRRK